MSKNHGGKRKGAGRKLHYGEKMVTIPRRVPASKLDEVVRWIEEKKEEWREQKKDETFYCWGYDNGNEPCNAQCEQCAATKKPPNISIRRKTI